MATLAEQLAEAVALRDAYVAAEIAVLKGQAYTIGGRAMRRADLVEIRAGRREWTALVQQLEAGGTGIRLRGATPVY